MNYSTNIENTFLSKQAIHANHKHIMRIIQRNVSFRIPNYQLTRNILTSGKSDGLSAISRLRYKSMNAPDLLNDYVGLIVRSIATLIDLVIVGGILLLIGTLFIPMAFVSSNVVLFAFIGLLVWVLYNTLFESSKYQATIGEMMLRIKVIDLYGHKMGFLRAISRCVSIIISILPFGIGIWYMSTDPKKQGWHDLISGTYVIKNGTTGFIV